MSVFEATPSKARHAKGRAMSARIGLKAIYDSGWFTMVPATVGVIALWYFTTNVLKVPSYLIPGPASVITSFRENWSSLAQESIATLREIIGGFVISVATAVPLALLVIYSPTFERFMNPLIVVSQAVPKVAVAPLFLVWFGFGEFPKMLIAALIAFFPMLISVTVGLKGLDPDMLDLARSMGAPGYRVFWKVRLPCALPNVFAGFKLAITFSVIGAVVGEFVGGDHGIGYLIQLASGAQRSDLLFAGLIVLSVMGLALFYLVEAFERKFVFWHHSQITPSA
jgi:NitT/TauT family transport system permease protein